MNGVAADAAAKAAGLAENELAALEESGRVTKSVNFSALAPLLGLKAGMLRKDQP